MIVLLKSSYYLMAIPKFHLLAFSPNKKTCRWLTRIRGLENCALKKCHHATIRSNKTLLLKCFRFFDFEANSKYDSLFNFKVAEEYSRSQGLFNGKL